MTTYFRNFRSLLAALALAIPFAAFGTSAVASEHAAAAAPAGEEHGKEKKEEKKEEAEAPLRTDVFDLGEFKIKNTLPTHHVTVELQFALNLILSSTTTLADVEHLQQWKQRLRDQTIIAVRSADPADFADPKLRRVRRLIMLRLRRLHVPANVIGLYLTDFAVDKAD